MGKILESAGIEGFDTPSRSLVPTCPGQSEIDGSKKHNNCFKSTFLVSHAKICHVMTHVSICIDPLQKPPELKHGHSGHRWSQPQAPVSMVMFPWSGDQRCCFLPSSKSHVLVAFCAPLSTAAKAGYSPLAATPDLPWTEMGTGLESLV